MKLIYFSTFFPLLNALLNDYEMIFRYKGLIQKDSYNNMIQSIKQHHINSLYINSNYKEIISVDNLPNVQDVYDHYHSIQINPVVIPTILEQTYKENIPIYFIDQNTNDIMNTITTIAGYMVPIFVVYFVISLLVNAFMQSPNGMPRSTGMPNLFQMMQKNDEYVKPNVSLDSWAGSPEVIEECIDVISYIENQEKYKKIGAEMPRGFLLEGPPGTGKTLLAKAIASSTNSTFIPIAASEFVELFVGMGAARVRQLFKTAREKNPSIIFIDEIDAVGRQRGVGMNMANDEREQTLNQLLYEMDGFQNNTNIIVMAATNRKDILDQALLRPGRFDRLIKVPLPDRESRKKILEYYLSQSKVDAPFDTVSIAELTDGFSGAQLKNLINEAAIFSVKNNYTTVQEQFIFDAFEKSLVGLIKRNASVLDETQERVAIHETGHALLAMHYHEYFNFQKVSIQPTYNGAGGYTIFTEKPHIKDGGLYTKDLLKKRLIIMMGGKAAESIYYGNDFVSVGAIQDLNQANRLAKRMIENFGMGDKLEVFYNEEILGREYSEYTKCNIDRESLDLVNEAFRDAKQILNNQKEKMVEFAELLQNKVVLYKKDI